MGEQRTKIEQYLTEKGVSFRGVEHAPAASAEEYNKTLGTRFTQQVKVLLLKCKKEGNESFCVLALQGHKKADLASAAKALNVTKARLADRDQLLSATGCNFGELHPFAVLYDLPLLMDEDFLSEDEVFINAGCLDYSIVVSPGDIVKTERPLLLRREP